LQSTGIRRKSAMAKDKFQISLRENGEHSLKNSLDSYKRYEVSKEPLFLKDAIMFLHHGIKLLMKEMLVNHSPYLMFEELRDIPKKQKEANKQGVSIFFIKQPPKSVTYEVAIDRVEAFINPPELTDNLRQNLTTLNRLRNQLEHYAIHADKEEVIRILEAIHEPILNLFENHLGPLTMLRTPQINQIWSNIGHIAKEHQMKIHEVYMLMEKFNFQKVPGRLFGQSGEMRLPKFDWITENYRMNLGDDVGIVEFDIFAECKDAYGEYKSWPVIIKLNPPSIDFIHMMDIYRILAGSTPWLIVFNELSNEFAEGAWELGLMVTNARDLQKLKELVESPDASLLRLEDGIDSEDLGDLTDPPF
jgi:hypothetical protein